MIVPLRPLPYHLEVATKLAALEVTSWNVFRAAAEKAAREARAAPAAPGEATAGPPPAADLGELSGDQDLEQLLLRHAYRIEPEAHPRVGAAVRQATDALGITVPVTVYQLEGVTETNAALAYRPHEAVLALSGNLLNLLSDAELVACLAHELAHHRLWSENDGQLLIADRLLSALTMSPGTPVSYLETARRFALATELYADRGSAIATGDLHVAIRALVKVATGLAEVDADAFLRQARAAQPEKGSKGDSHPETVLRAWALERWHEGTGDAAATTLVSTSMDIERLDIFDREQLEDTTRRLVKDVIAVDWMRTDPVLSHARQFGIETGGASTLRGMLRQRVAATTTAPPVQVHGLDATPLETRRFLSFVLLDLATIDPELEEEALAEVAAVARETGLGPTFEAAARKELGIKDRAWDSVVKRSADRRVAPVAPAPDPTPDPAPDEPEPATADAPPPVPSDETPGTSA